MRLKNIRGKEVSVDVRPNSYAQTGRSKRQNYVRDLIKQHCPFETVVQEFTIPGSRMSIDLFFPKIMVAVEVQGEQHLEFNAHFHGTILDKNFSKQKNRDSKKYDWCKINDIDLVEIEPKDSDKTIMEKFNGRGV